MGCPILLFNYGHKIEKSASKRACLQKYNFYSVNVKNGKLLFHLYQGSYVIKSCLARQYICNIIWIFTKDDKERLKGKRKKERKNNPCWQYFQIQIKSKRQTVTITQRSEKEYVFSEKTMTRNLPKLTNLNLVDLLDLF